LAGEWSSGDESPDSSAGACQQGAGWALPRTDSIPKQQQNGLAIANAKISAVRCFIIYKLEHGKEILFQQG